MSPATLARNNTASAIVESMRVLRDSSLSSYSDARFSADVFGMVRSSERVNLLNSLIQGIIDSYGLDGGDE